MQQAQQAIHFELLVVAVLQDSRQSESQSELQSSPNHGAGTDRTKLLTTGARREKNQPPSISLFQRHPGALPTRLRRSLSAI